MAQDTVQITVAVPRARALILQEQAERHGFTVHRYMQKLITDMTNSGKRAPAYVHVPDADKNAEPLTETIIVEMELPLAQRLHTAARQMTTPSGAPCSPTWLARQILLHLCHEPSDIMERIREINPHYQDLNQFPGRLYVRCGRYIHPMPIKFTLQGRTAVIEAARQRGMSVTGMARKLFDRVLPKFDPAPPVRPDAEPATQTAE